MTTLPEEAVKAAQNAIRTTNWEYGITDADMAKALTAALPFLPVQGAVKKLDWRKGVEFGAITAHGAGVDYTIWSDFSLSISPMSPREYHLARIVKAEDQEGAKSVAQADYTSRILSALEPSAGDMGNPITLDIGKPITAPSAARELALEEAAQVAEMLPECDLLSVNGNEVSPAVNDAFKRGAFAQGKAIAAAIRALSSPDHADAGKVEGDGWLPIESAPKDGAEIIYLTKYGSIGFCRYAVDNINDWFGWWDLQADDEVYPKHWLPRSALPSAPSEGAE